MIGLAVLGALLLSRMLILLFAARPDNPGMALIIQLTTPLVWPLAWIDSMQPQYGARFERGTLLAFVLCWLASWGVTRRYSA